MARQLFDLLGDLGHRVTLASRLRLHEGRGDARRQRELRAAAGREVERLLAAFRADPRRRPELWFTYHLYHKAPDLLGPAVARALAIPYVVAEASVAPKQAKGPWRQGYRESLRALQGAALVLAMTERDAVCLRRFVPAERLRRLPPFIDPQPFLLSEGKRERIRRRLAAELALSPSRVWLLTVAMMRRGAKLRSYRLLAGAAGLLADAPVEMLVVGDGPARAEIERMFGEALPRTRFLGMRPEAELPALYGASDLFLWPGFEEAYGMVYLEAQAAGLPVVALREAGVAEVVEEGVGGRLAEAADAAAFASLVRDLLDADRRRRMARSARRHVLDAHSRAAAARILEGALRPLRAGCGGVASCAS